MAAEGEGALAAAIEAFLAAAAVERGLAPHTLEAYARDLARFAGHLERRGVGSPADVCREHVTSFVASLERQGLAARSRARALVAVRRWLRHAGTTGASGQDPCAGVALPRSDRRLPRVLRPDETAALIEAADPGTALGLRDRAMLEVLYGSGLRVSASTRGPASPKAWSSRPPTRPVAPVTRRVCIPSALTRVPGPAPGPRRRRPRRRGRSQSGRSPAS